MIVDCNGERNLGVILTYDILVEHVLDLMRRNKLLGLDGTHLALLVDFLFFGNDTVSRSDAVNADIAVDAREESRNFIFGLSAE